MISRKPSEPAHSKPKTATDPGSSVPPVVPSAAEAKRTAAREAAVRLAKMSAEEQAAALFKSMLPGGLKPQR